MTTQIQRRRGTTAQHSTFTGAEAELTVDTTKDTVVVHDGSTVGGRPLLREDQSNLPTSAPTTGIYNASGSLAISTNGTGRLFINSSGDIGMGTNALINNAGYTTLFLNGSTGGSIGFKTGDVIKQYIYSTGTTLNYYGGGSDSHIFYCNTEKMRLTPTGLGVGTSSPAFKLQVNSSAASPATIASFRNTAVNSVYVELNDQTGNSTYLGSEDGRFVVQTPGSGYSTKFCVTSSGNVGVGTTSPGCIFHAETTGAEIARLNSTAGIGGYLSVQTSGSYVGYFGAATALAGSGTSSDLAIRAQNSLLFTIGSTERARIDSSGRLLVGTSSASASFSALLQNASGDSFGILGLAANTATPADNSSLGDVRWSDSGHTLAAMIRCRRDGGTWSGSSKPTRLEFSTTADGASSPTERMRLDSNGDIGLSTTSDGLFGKDPRLAVAKIVAAGKCVVQINAAGSFGNTDRNALECIDDGGEKLYIRQNGNVVNQNNSYGAISDAKLKENVVDASSQWGDIKALKVRNYNFKSDPSRRQIGVVAQELELVSPGVVTDSPDYDAEGNDLGTVTKSVNYSVLYMKAVKALQEAMERIELLEARLDAANL